MPEPEVIDVGNYQGVSRRGDEIVVLIPRQVMTKTEALVHAAWLATIAADSDDDFMRVLQAVRNT